MAHKDDTKVTITSERLQNVIQALSFASVDEFESCLALLEKSETQDEFKELDFDAVAQAMSGKLIIDGRNALDPAAVTAAGLIYEGIGRS